LDRLRGVPFDQVKGALPDLLSTYDLDISNAEKYLLIRGKTGAQVLKEQTAWSAYYGMRKAEVSKLCKYMEAQVEACRGRLFKKYVENYSRTLSERTIDKYINNEAEYLSFYEALIEIEEIKDKMTAICDGFTSRGFSIRDWTQLKIVQSQDDTI
jgi:hypothetical protein